MGAVRRLVDELRRRGVTVHEWPGWDGRGNEGVAQIDPKGAIIHHTATNYGSAFSDLVSSTQAWARGNALCNVAGNADGSFTVVASGIGWHAGQGAGPSLGKLAPWRNRLNYYSVGLEIVYPGDRPMTDAQYQSALLFARTVADLFGGGDIECVRAHAETNGRGGDGKWDPGYAPGKTIDMVAFRRAAATIQEDDMPYSPEQLKDIVKGAIYEAKGNDGRNVLDSVIQTRNELRDRAREAVAAELAGLAAAVGRLTEAVATGDGVTADELKQAVTDAIKDAVVRVDVNVQGEAK